MTDEHYQRINAIYRFDDVKLTDDERSIVNEVTEKYRDYIPHAVVAVAEQLTQITRPLELTAEQAFFILIETNPEVTLASLNIVVRVLESITPGVCEKIEKFKQIENAEMEQKTAKIH